jgi:hypothetical protein
MGYALATQYSDLFDPDGKDTPEDIFKVIFTPVQFNLEGFYYTNEDFDGRGEVAPTDGGRSLARSGPDRHRHLGAGHSGVPDPLADSSGRADRRTGADAEPRVLRLPSSCPPLRRMVERRAAHLEVWATCP